MWGLGSKKKNHFLSLLGSSLPVWQKIGHLWAAFRLYSILILKPAWKCWTNVDSRLAAFLDPTVFEVASKIESGLWVSFSRWPYTLSVLSLCNPYPDKGEGSGLQWVERTWTQRVLSTGSEPFFVVLNFTLWSFTSSNSSNLHALGFYVIGHQLCFHYT